MKIPKPLIVGLFVVVMFALPACSLFGWIAALGIPGILVSAYIFFINILLLGLLIELFLTDWNKQNTVESIKEVTLTWGGSVALVTVVLAGILFPAAVLVIETNTHLCSQYFIDLIPSKIHLALLALGPVINTFCVLQLYFKNRVSEKILSFINGVAMGIAIPFSIVMLPLLPMSILAVAFGISWIPLSPMLAFFSTIKLFGLMSVFAPDLKSEKRLRFFGLLTGCTLFILLQCPVIITNYLVESVVLHPDNRDSLELLRNFGDREQLVRLCYKPKRIKTIAELVSPTMDVQNAQAVLLKVTGREFRSFPRPESVKSDDIWASD